MAITCELCGNKRLVSGTSYCLRCYLLVRKFEQKEFTGACGRVVKPALSGRGAPCMNCHESWYEYCLDKAARLDWPGWRVCDGFHTSFDNPSSPWQTDLRTVAARDDISQGEDWVERILALGWLDDEVGHTLRVPAQFQDCARWITPGVVLIADKWLCGMLRRNCPARVLGNRYGLFRKDHMIPRAFARARDMWAFLCNKKGG